MMHLIGLLETSNYGAKTFAMTMFVLVYNSPLTVYLIPGLNRRTGPFYEVNVIWLSHTNKCHVPELP